MVVFQKFLDSIKYYQEDRFLQIIAQNADVIKQTDLEGNTALHFSAQYSNIDWTLKLLEKGADPKIKNNYGYTPLASAVDHMVSEEYDYKNYIELAKILLKAGDNIGSLDVLNKEYRGRSQTILNDFSSSLTEAMEKNTSLLEEPKEEATTAKSYSHRDNELRRRQQESVLREDKHI